MGSNKNKRYDGVVYSTNPDFQYKEIRDDEDLSTGSTKNKSQDLRVMLDKKMRGGKQVTLVTGWTGKTGDLEILGKMLKSKCGVGGSVKDREIIIQGDHRKRIIEILLKEGFKAKQSGG